MTRSRFSAASVLLSALLASSGCGFTSSPADNLSFKAPPGWQGSPGIMGFMQFWKAPSGNNEVLMLFKSPKPLKIQEALNSANLRDAKVEIEKSITICTNQPAAFFKAKGTSSRRDSNIEMVMTNAAGTTYLAMYVYPADAAPNGQAAAALRELCPK